MDFIVKMQITEAAYNNINGQIDQILIGCCSIETFCFTSIFFNASLIRFKIA